MLCLFIIPAIIILSYFSIYLILNYHWKHDKTDFWDESLML